MRASLLLLLAFSLTLSSCLKDLPTPEEQLATDKKIIEDYLKSKNLTAQSTASGLYYIIDQPGGGGHPTLQSTVTVEYKGYFTNGSVFDQTEAGKTATFPLNGVIQGWQEGIPLFQKGGKGTLLVPSGLGYGPYGQAPIGANTVIIFDVTLVDFK